MRSLRGLDPTDVLELVVRPTLAQLAVMRPGINSVSAEQLLMGTAAQESKFQNLRQRARADGRRGPALGIFQMEPATHDDVWGAFLKYRTDLWRDVARLTNTAIAGYEESEIREADGPSYWPDAATMTWNLRYAAAMARVHYLRVRAPLPNVDDVWSMALYWDRHYNRNPDAGMPAEFKESWRYFDLSRLWK